VKTHGDAPCAPALGFLGGTFDPPHAGHLALAQAARSALTLSRVWLIPAGRPWQKTAVSAAAHRLRMTELLAADASGLDVDRREVDRDRNSYTFDTLRELRSQWGPRARLVWLIGSDQLSRLHTWHRWRDLLSFAHIAVAWRVPDAPALSGQMQTFYDQHRASIEATLALPQGRIIDIPMTTMDISATALRALLSRPAQSLTASETQQLHAHLPLAVLDYIRTHGLYQTEPHH